MKTSEFIYEVKRLRGLELKVETYGEMIKVRNRFNEHVLVIDVDGLCNVDTRFNGFRKLNNDDKIALYMLCNSYVMNSVGVEKKYKLKHKLIKVNGYLNYVESDKELIFSTEIELGDFRTVFTIQEWETLTGQNWEVLLLQFKAIEV